MSDCEQVHRLNSQRISKLDSRLYKGQKLCLRCRHCYQAQGGQVTQLHAGTVVPECIKDDSASQWKGGGKFDPARRSLQTLQLMVILKLAWVMRSGTPTPVQYFITIRSRGFLSPSPRAHGVQVTRLVFWVPGFWRRLLPSPRHRFYDQYIK